VCSSDAAVPVLGWGLWEVRSDLPGNRIARVFFCFTEGRLVALHGLIKKTRKTPEADLKLARKRKREFKSEQGL
jgi:phage-related protein